MLIEDLTQRGIVAAQDRHFVERFELPRIRRIHVLIRKHTPAPEVLRVLDIGLLAGLVALTLLSLDEDMTIISTERPGADTESAGLAALRATGRHDVMTMDLTAAASVSDRFDWVVCGEVLEHLPSPSLPRALRNLHDAAERVVITTPNLHALRYRVRHLLGVDYGHDPVPNATMGLGHVSLLSARLLVDLAADAGLAATDVEFHSWTSDAQGPKHRALARATRRIGSLGDDIVAAFRRDEDVRPSAGFGDTFVPLRAGISAARRAAKARPST